MSTNADNAHDLMCALMHLAEREGWDFIRVFALVKSDFNREKTAFLDDVKKHFEIGAIEALDTFERMT